MSRLRGEPLALGLDRRVHGILVDLVGELGDEVGHRGARVRHLRLEVPVNGRTRRVAGDPLDQVALAAHVERLVDHAVDVSRLVQLVRGQRVVVAVEVDDHRLLQRGHNLALDHPARGVGVPAPDVHAADLDARGDPVLLGVVVGPDRDREQEQHRHRHAEGDHELLLHVEPCAHQRVLDQASLSGILRVRGPRPCLGSRPQFALRGYTHPAAKRCLPSVGSRSMSENAIGA